MEEPNILCASNKYVSYTNIDSIEILWDYIEVGNIYIENGLVKESGTGAILVAMGTYYPQDYYYITMENGRELYVKNVDIKAPEHTDYTNCYTTADDSIIEIWVTNEFKYLWAGISKHTEFGTVVEIKGIE
jgi:hypothetical protein